MNLKKKYEEMSDEEIQERVNNFTIYPEHEKQIIKDEIQKRSKPVKAKKEITEVEFKERYSLIKWVLVLGSPVVIVSMIFTMALMQKKYAIRPPKLFLIMGIWGMLFGVILCSVQILINMFKGLSVKIKDFKAMFYFTVVTGLSCGFGLFPVINYYTTIDKVFLKGKVIEHVRFMRYGSASLIKEKNKTYIIPQGSFEFKIDSKIKRDNEILLIGDEVELEMEKGLFGILKNPKVKIIKKGDEK